VWPAHWSLVLVLHREKGKAKESCGGAREEDERGARVCGLERG
jgi:hypothetical protein